MYDIALKILFGDRGKYLGIITGIALASLIMIQQPGILVSILSHTYSFISDINLPDIWVMDPKVKFIDDSPGRCWTPSSTGCAGCRPVNGFRVTHEHQAAFFAAKVKKNDQTLNLLDEHGSPFWKQQDAGGPGSERASRGGRDPSQVGGGMMGAGSMGRGR